MKEKSYSMTKISVSDLVKGDIVTLRQPAPTLGAEFAKVETIHNQAKRLTVRLMDGRERAVNESEVMKVWRYRASLDL